MILKREENEHIITYSITGYWITNNKFENEKKKKGKKLYESIREHTQLMQFR